MIDCTAVRDRMPGVAHGRDRWTEAETVHLAGCTECESEWRLVQAGRGLRAGTTIDGDRIAETVVARLRAAPPAASGISRLPWRGGLIGLLAAAASVVLILSAPRTQRIDQTGGADVSAVTILPELERLSDGELETVLQSLGPTAADATPGVLPHLEDLTDSELEQLLHSKGE